MMKKIAVILMMSVFVLMMSSCYEDNIIIEPHPLDELTSPDETMSIDEEVVVEESITIPIVEIPSEPEVFIETVLDSDDEEEPQQRVINTSTTPEEPTETVSIPTPSPVATPRPVQSQTPASTPKPTQPQATVPNPTPAPQPTPAPVPQPTPAPTPPPTPAPTPKPEPIPIYEERSICSCGDDITGNTTAHMKNHALNDDGHGSWRSEMRIVGYK